MTVNESDGLDFTLDYNGAIAIVIILLGFSAPLLPSTWVSLLLNQPYQNKNLHHNSS